MEIKTNNQPRPILFAYELTDKEKQEFDYIEDINSANCFSSFFRYKGEVYDIGEFMWICSSSPLYGKGWEGYSSDSYFSGIVVKYHDTDSIIVGTYYS